MMLLYVYIFWLVVCVDPINADQITVTAVVGSTTLLPCYLTRAFTNTSVVRWHVSKEVVFERSSGGVRAGPGYEGRVDVPEEELRKGNCSLVLKNVSIRDENLYRSFVMEHVDNPNSNKEITRVKLSVVIQVISALVGSTVLLPCDWSNLGIQTPHVEWKINPEIVFERKGKESFQGKGYEGRVDVPENELLKGNCSLVMKHFNVTDEGVYSSSMGVKLTKEHVLVQKVQLSVYEKPQERKNESSVPSGLQAGMSCLLIIITSIFVYLLFTC